MDDGNTIHISREDLFGPNVDKAIAHQKALTRQARPIQDTEVSKVRRLLLSSMFHTPVAGLLGGLTAWLIIEPYFDDTNPGVVAYFIFPLLATLIVLFIFVADGVASRRVRGSIERWTINTGLTTLFSFLAFIPAVLILMLGAVLFLGSVDRNDLRDVSRWPATAFEGWTVTRSCGWAILGAALGLGMNVARSTGKRLRNSVLGGTVGGALGGLFFDPIDRFIVRSGGLSRAVGFCSIGLCVGLFVALGERLGREAWLRVKTGPLAGKSFVLYRNSTIIGSSPQDDIYLFKDAEIGSAHATIHKIGNAYEIEDHQTKYGSTVNNRRILKQRLISGDQIAIGATVLEFEERAKRGALRDVTIKDN